jgi:c-di-AMP phosphodiesterase-like protein
MSLLLGISAYALIMFFLAIICFFILERSSQDEVTLILILLIFILFTLFSLQSCSKQEFKCNKENIDKTIIQTCNNSNDKEACREDVINILSLSCGINKTDLK